MLRKYNKISTIWVVITDEYIYTVLDNWRIVSRKKRSIPFDLFKTIKNSYDKNINICNVEHIPGLKRVIYEYEKNNTIKLEYDF